MRFVKNMNLNTHIINLMTMATELKLRYIGFR